MQLSSKIYHVNAGLTNQFLFMFSIVREFDQFIVLLELFKLRIQDEPTLEIVIKHCNENPNRRSILNKVDNQLQDSMKLDYYQVENYLPQLEDHYQIINEKYNDEKLFKFPITDKFRVIFNKKQVNRFYNDLKAFYSNYIILESTFQMSLPKEEKKEVVNVSEKKDTLKNEYYQEELPKPQERSKFDEIFDLCINNTIKSFLIHITVNYYIYVGEKHVFIEDNKINLPSLFPLIYVFNLKYFESLISSLNSYTIENIKMRCDKILRKLQDDQTTSIEMMILCGLLFVYYLRFLSESHTDYLLNNTRKLFNDTDLQSRLLTNHTKNYFPNQQISFHVNEINLDEIEEINLENKIEEVGEKYSHLKSVSEEDFIDKIMKDLDDNEPELILNNKKILSLDHLKNRKSAGVKKNNLDNPEFQNTDAKDELTEYNCFRYNFQDEYITEAYKLFNEFIEDQNTFLIKLKKDELNTNIPKTVINLFEVLSRILYDKEIKIQQYSNTYTYYQILKNNINDVNAFPHIIILYIIFQIIIPHLYLQYNIKEFEDVLN